MGNPGSAGLEGTQQVLAEEREALVAWLGNLERRQALGEERYERIAQLRRLIGMLDNRIRLIRDFGEWDPAQLDLPHV